MKYSLPKRRKNGKKNAAIGLDIGHSYIKLISLLPEGNGIRLDKYFIQPILSSSSISASLKDLFSKCDFPVNKVNISLAGDGTLVRNIWIPQMSSNELNASVKYELGQYIPFPVDSVYYDISILEKGPFTRRENQMRILLAAVKKQMLKERLKSLKDAGFAVSVVDMDALALCNAFLWHSSDSQKKSISALIGLGSAKTTIDIISNGILTFTRELSLGTGLIRDAVSNGLSMSKDNAEKMICKGDPRIDLQVRDFASKLGREIWKSFEYYEGQEQVSIEKVYLTGGGSLLLGLVNSLSQIVTIPLEVWNPLNKVEIDKNSAMAANLDKIAPLMTVAYGLACREL